MDTAKIKMKLQFLAAMQF